MLNTLVYYSTSNKSTILTYYDQSKIKHALSMVMLKLSSIINSIPLLKLNWYWIWWKVLINYYNLVLIKWYIATYITLQKVSSCTSAASWHLWYDHVSMLQLPHRSIVGHLKQHPKRFQAFIIKDVWSRARTNYYNWWFTQIMLTWFLREPPVKNIIIISGSR